MNHSPCDNQHSIHLDLPDRELHFALLGRVCAEQKIQLSRLSKDYLAVLSRAHQTHYIWGRDFGLNPASSAAVLNDKYAIYETLTYHRIPAVECQIIYAPGDSNPWAKGCNSLAYAESYFEHHQRHIVIKPNHGSQGIGVQQVSDRAELATAYQNVFRYSYSASLCPFYNIKHEYRVVLLDSDVRLAYMKTNCGDWRFNLHHGALASPIPSSDYPAIVALASQAYNALDLRFCSVDVIKTTQNQLLVMELNNGVTLTGYLKQHPTELERILNIYRDAVAKIFAHECTH